MAWQPVADVAGIAVSIFVALMSCGAIAIGAALSRQRHAEVVAQVENLLVVGDLADSARYRLEELRAHHVAEYILTLDPNEPRLLAGWGWKNWLRGVMVLAGLSFAGALIYVEWGTPEGGSAASQWMRVWLMLALILQPTQSIYVDRILRRLDANSRYESLGGTLRGEMGALKKRLPDGVILWWITFSLSIVASLGAFLTSEPEWKFGLFLGALIAVLVILSPRRVWKFSGSE